MYSKLALAAVGMAALVQTCTAQCSAYNFAGGIVGGDATCTDPDGGTDCNSHTASDTVCEAQTDASGGTCVWSGACTDNIQLALSGTCEVKCDSGYTAGGSGTTLTCSANGQAASTSLTCTSTNTCTCTDGTEATGAACDTNNAAKCASCDAGFTLASDACTSTNTCTCADGTEATGTACDTNNAAKCASCDAGFTLANDACTETITTAAATTAAATTAAATTAAATTAAATTAAATTAAPTGLSAGEDSAATATLGVVSALAAAAVFACLL